LIDLLIIWKKLKIGSRLWIGKIAQIHHTGTAT